MRGDFFLKTTKFLFSYIDALRSRIATHGFLIRLVLALWMLLCMLALGVSYSISVVFYSTQTSFQFFNELHPERGYTVSYSKHQSFRRRLQLGAVSSTLVIVVITMLNGFFIGSLQPAITAPNTPSISYPAAAATSVNRNPFLKGSTFSASDGAHMSTDWKVTSDSNGDTVVWSSVGDTQNLTTTIVNAQRGTFVSGSELTANTTYYAFVRYTNAAGTSAWSSASSFTTQEVKYVSPSGTNTGTTSGCANPASPCQTINYVIDNSTSGTLIIAGAGTYTEIVRFDGKALDIQGNGATGTQASIIDGAGTRANGVVFDSNSTLDSKIHGFTIKGATSYAIEVEGSGGTIYDNHVIDNANQGIRISGAGGIAHIYNNVISSNNSGGINFDLTLSGTNIEEGSSIIERNIIAGNGVAAGIRIIAANNSYKNHVYIRNNTIISNTGDGIDVSGAMIETTEVRNNILAHNNAHSIDTSDVISLTSCAAAYNDSYNNTTSDESSAECAFSNGFTSNPQFVVSDSGNSDVTTGITATVLTDSDKNWTTDQWAGYYVFADTTTTADYRRVWYILSNTATTLTVASTSSAYDMLDFDTIAAGGDPYVISDLTLEGGSSLNNAGDPDAVYNDSDGTRNNIGHSGGVSSRPVPAVPIPNIHGVVNTSITLDGGDVVSVGRSRTYAWTQTSGTSVTLNNSTTSTPSFTPISTGTYAFTYTVTDDENTLTSPISKTVTVRVHDGVTRTGSGTLYSTINAAATAASDGDTITIPNGTFVEFINFGTKDLILDGAGRTTTGSITTIDGDYFSGAGRNGVAMNDNSLNGSTIQDLIIKSFGGTCLLSTTGSNSETNIASNLEITDCAEGAILGGTVSQTISDSWIHDNIGSGYTANSTVNRLTVTNTIFAGNTTDGISTNSDWCTIQKSVFAGNGETGVSCAVNIVENNFFVGNDLGGLLTTGGTSENPSYIRNNTFIGNDVSTTSQAQLRYQDTTPVINVINNIVTHGPSYGLTCGNGSSGAVNSYNYIANNATNTTFGTSCATAGTGTITTIDSNLFVVSDSGTNESVTVNTLTDSDKNWTINQWTNYFLIGNTTSNSTSRRVWMIKSNTADTLTLYTSAAYELTDSSYVTTGVGYEIISGKIQSTSVTYNAGTNTNAATEDYFGTARPLADTTDIGANEYDASTAADPTISSPTAGATGQSRVLTVTSSTYTGSDLSHTSSDWQISDDNTFSDGDCSDTNIVYCSLDSANRTSIVLNASNGTFQNALSGKTALAPSTNYYIRVRYTNATGDSGWSTAVNFTTTTNIVPSTPSNAAPANAATDVSKNPTLTSSAFSDSDGDTHLTSDWFVYEASDCSGTGDWSKTGETSNLVSVVVNTTNGTFADALVGQTTLKAHTQYSFKVRYTDSANGNTSYSNCTSFTTTNTTPAFDGVIPDQDLTEDTNVTAAFDLDTYFSDVDFNDDDQYNCSATNGFDAVLGTMTINENRTVDFTLASNANGSDTIELSCQDGGGLSSVSNSITVTVAAVNDVPTISDVGNQTINEDSATSALGLTISDVETAAGSLTMSGSSSNTTLVPNDNIVFGGSGESRTVTVTPVSNESGTATITIGVNDGTTTTNDTFTLTVTAVNDAPTISDVSNQIINEDSATSALGLTISDVETAAGSLTMSGSSSNTTLVPNDNIVFGGSGTNRTATITPAANQNGTATITLTVSDGTASTDDTLTLTVNAVNDPPTANAGSDVTINEDLGSIELNGTGSSDLDAGTILTYLWTESSDTSTSCALSESTISTPSVSITNRTTSYTCTFSLEVSDGTVTATDTMTLSITADNDAPTANAGSDQTITEDTSSATLSATASSDADIGQTLSYAWAEVLDSADACSLGGFSGTTTTVTPANKDSSYSCEYRLTVSDGIASAEDRVVVNVSADNDAPSLTSVADKSVNEADELTFSLGATDSDTTSVTLSVTDPNGDFSQRDISVDELFTDIGNNTGTFSWTPDFDEAGNYQVTFEANDGRTTASEIVNIAVADVNTTPTFSGSLPAVAFVAGTTTSKLFNLNDYFSDEDRDTLTYTAQGQQSVEVEIATSGSVTMTTPKSFAGTETITFIATDPLDASVESNAVVVVVSEAEEENILPEQIDHVAGKSTGAGVITIVDENNQVLAEWKAFPNGGVIPRIATVNNRGYIFAVKKKYGSTMHIYTLKGQIVKKIRLSEQVRYRKLATGNLDTNPDKQEIVIATHRDDDVFFRVFSFNARKNEVTLEKRVKYRGISTRHYTVVIDNKTILLRNKEGKTVFRWKPLAQ